MCDTMLAPPSVTESGTMLFAKNSDRQRNEAHAVERIPAIDHDADTVLRCTYISIPQVRRTHAMLLCRPSWIWGAEMGANTHGVVIGNEGLHARVPAPTAPALTGMDLVRLGLERAASAAEALDIITGLLETHGQGGNCGHLVENYYNNGFLIADAREAFVLETIGRDWLAERVTAPRALSNIYSIETPDAGMSTGMPALLQRVGWQDLGRPPSYAAAITAPDREHIGHAAARRGQATARLTAAGSRTVKDMMAALRDHGSGDPSAWSPDTAKDVTICMHAGESPRFGQTTGSLVSDIRAADAVHWVTATSAPCLSIFKPVLLDVDLPLGPPPGDHYDPASLWWRHEAMHRTAIKRGLGDFAREIVDERDALEQSFMGRLDQVAAGGSADERRATVARCWAEAEAAERRWRAILAGRLPQPSNRFMESWVDMNALAGVPADGLSA